MPVDGNVGRVFILRQGITLSLSGALIQYKDDVSPV